MQNSDSILGDVQTFWNSSLYAKLLIVAGAVITSVWTIKSGLLAVLIFGIIYFVPTIIAHRRHHRQAWAITVLDILLGWTGVGWVAALVWACTTDVERQVQQSPAPTPPT